MTQPSLRTLAARFAFVAMALGADVPDVSAQVACGGTVGPGGTVKLLNDLGPCPGPFALRVVGPVTLDLGQRTIRCGAGSGLELTGRSVKIRGGTLTGCVNGVVFASGSGHRIERTKVLATKVFGLVFHRDSDRNRALDVQIEGGVVGVQIDGGSDRHVLEHVESDGADFAGFVVAGTRTTLDDCDADRATVGFMVDGTKHRLHDNDARDCRESGYEIRGAGHVLTVNDARTTGSAAASGTGFLVRARDVKIVAGTATGTAGNGYRIEASQRVLLDDVDSTLNEDDGIVIRDAAVIEVRRAFVQANGDHGIHVRSGVRKVRVRDNVVSDHLAPDHDLRDDDPSCAGTLWQDNDFLRGAPACVQ